MRPRLPPVRRRRQAVPSPHRVAPSRVRPASSNSHDQSSASTQQRRRHHQHRRAPAPRPPTPRHPNSTPDSLLSWPHTCEPTPIAHQTRHRARRASTSAATPPHRKTIVHPGPSRSRSSSEPLCPEFHPNLLCPTSSSPARRSRRADRARVRTRQERSEVEQRSLVSARSNDSRASASVLTVRLAVVASCRGALRWATSSTACSSCARAAQRRWNCRPSS